MTHGNVSVISPVYIKYHMPKLHVRDPVGNNQGGLYQTPISPFSTNDIVYLFECYLVD